MRSLLLVPGASERELEQALASGADALIVDLKGSSVARERLISFLPGAPKDRPRIYVRIDNLDSALAHDDLAAIVPAKPAGIVLPKSDGAADIVKLSARLNVSEAKAGLPEGATQIIAFAAATAVGALSMDYRNSTPRLVGLGWDAESLAASIGARAVHDENGDYTGPFCVARALTLFGARAANVAAIDTAYIPEDEAGLKRDCALAVRDGFTAKLAIHPAQIPIINAAFAG